MERILAVLLLALLAGFAQISPSPTGAPCTAGLGSSGNVYDFSTYLKCCSELAQPTITTAADCETYCTSQNQPWIYGYFRNATYDTCVCLLNCVDVPSDVSQGDYRQLVETSQTPNTTVTDLISSAPDFEIDVNSTQVTLSPNQTAEFQTNINIEGNMIHFIAMPSVSGLSAGSIIGFTVRDLYDFRTITPTVTFRNNSFEISCFLYYYDPPVQYKRQLSPSDTFTYTMKNLGDRVLVVLSAGGQAVVSWYYEPIASNTDNTISTLANSFTFDLAFEQSTSLAYQSCTDNLCYDSTLYVCQNGTNTETKFCYMGCDSDGLDCVQCNSDTCQGTCAVNSTTPQCVCSGTNIGAGCQTDLATSTFYLSGSYDYNNQRYVTVSFDISNCVVGENCATVSYLYIGTTNSSLGSCCTTQLNFAALDASPQSGTILTFNREGDWTCFNGDELTLDPSLLDSYFELSFSMTDSVSWYWNDMTLESSTQSLYTCNSDITNLSQPEKVITTLILEVGLPFLCASCVAVAIGFLVGMRTAPNGMTIKRKEPLDKGCVPRNNDTMAQSIIAIIVLDVSLVTSFNIIGLIFPVSMAVLASGVILIIMTYQIDQVGARVGRKPSTVHKLQTVQRVFGRISGAFLILLGAVVFVVGLAFFVYGNLTTIIYYISPLIGWFVLAIYLTWSLVIVHFVAAIYVSVCFFFTAVRTDEQESIRAHNIELDERPDNIEL